MLLETYHQQNFPAENYLVRRFKTKLTDLFFVFLDRERGPAVKSANLIISR